MDNKQPMCRFAFYVMTAIMRVRGLFRNKKEEVFLTGAKEGDVILDYGCGIGFSTLAAAEIVGQNGKVYALDIHPLAIKALNEKVRKAGLNNVETILSSMDTGIADEAVDIVLLYNILPMIRNRPRLIREIFRVLKPGGTLSVKNGLGVTLGAREKIREVQLIELMRHNGPLNLNEKKGGFFIFRKNPG